MRLKKAKLSGGGGDTSSNAATPDGSPAKTTNKRKANGDVTKPAAKRGRKPNAAKAAVMEHDGKVDDEENGVKQEVKEEEIAEETEEVGQEADEEA